MLIFQDQHIIHIYFFHQVARKLCIDEDLLYSHLDTLQG